MSPCSRDGQVVEEGDHDRLGRLYAELDVKNTASFDDAADPVHAGTTAPAK
jgi:hypothetical protein